MESFSLIINLAAEFAKLARTLVADGIRFIALLARSRTALAAENLFLRKQLAFYQERKIKPRRFDGIDKLSYMPPHILDHLPCYSATAHFQDTKARIRSIR